MKGRIIVVLSRAALFIAVFGTLIVGCQKEGGRRVDASPHNSAEMAAPRNGHEERRLGARPSSAVDGATNAAELDFPGLSEDDGRGRDRK